MILLVNFVYLQSISGTVTPSHTQLQHNLADNNKDNLQRPNTMHHDQKNFMQEMIKRAQILNQPDIRDTKGNTPLMKLIQAKEREKETVNFLLNKEAIIKTINAQNHAGQTALMLACQNGDIELVKKLISLGAQIDLKDNQGCQLLPYTVDSENVELMEYLLNNNLAHLNDVDKEGHSLLIPAILNESHLMISRLLDMGIQTSKPDIQGRKPIEFARDAQMSHIIGMIASYEQAYGRQHPIQFQQYLQYCQNAHMVRYAGHVLGISADVPMQFPITNEIVKVRMEQGLTHESIAELHNIVKQYVAEIHFDEKTTEKRFLKDHFSAIEQGLQLAATYLNTPSPQNFKKLIEGINDTSKPPKVTFIPCGGGTHDLGVVKVGDLLVVTNRGAGRLRSGTMIYKLKTGIFFTPELLKSLRDPKEVDPLKIQARVLALIDDQFAGIPLDSKPQNHDTCSFVNPKSAIEGALFALKLYELPADRFENIFRTLKIDKKSLSEETDEARQSRITAMENDILAKLHKQPDFQELEKYAEKHYKHFTKKMRDNKIDYLIDEFQKSVQKNDAEKIEILKHIFVNYLFEHYGREKYHSRGEVPKHKAEIARAKRILEAIGETHQKDLLSRLEQLVTERNIPFDLSARLQRAVQDLKVQEDALKKQIQIDFLKKAIAFGKAQSTVTTTNTPSPAPTPNPETHPTTIDRTQKPSA